jgi:hypothetical protein
MALEFKTSCLADALDLFRFYRGLGERAIGQVTDEQLFAVLDPEMNSIAVTVKHMAGNMRSRWTGFLTSDGEKPDRGRDREFVEPPPSREGVMALWNQGWALVFAALEPLSDADMNRTVTIRGEAHSVTQAVHRQVAHYAYHVGQIVMLAKHFSGAGWNSLSIPRNRSAEFNTRVAGGAASQR